MENVKVDIFVMNAVGIGINLPLLQALVNVSRDIFVNLGAGYNEVVYHRAFEVALRTEPCLQQLGAKYQTEVITPVIYKGFNIGHGRIDLIVTDASKRSMIIELKSLSNFGSDTGVTQIKNYMKQYSINEGLVINFGQPNKACSLGELGIKFIYGDKIYNFVNDTFVEQVNMNIS
jgi:GxxExxY protein